MGLCFPKQCTSEEVSYFTSELIKGYAEGIGWENVSIDYHLASQYDDKQIEENKAGIGAFGVMMMITCGLVGVGTIIELSSIGNRDEYKTEDMLQPLYEASKFRRLQQYDSVLL